jgi:hypothetical protein
MKTKRVASALQVVLVGLTTVLAGCGSDDRGASGAFIAWSRLRNPILSAPDRALKDVAVSYDASARRFYIFTSTRFAPDDPESATKVPAFYSTQDFVAFDTFTVANLISGGGGPGSPDVTRFGARWHMVFQRSTPAGGDVLALSTSADLQNWTTPVALAPDVMSPALRNIDGALAERDGYFYLGWKRIQQFVVTRSVERALDGQWLPARAASAAGEFAENFQFLAVDGAWRLLATGRDPGPYRCDKPIYAFYTCDHEPFLYRMDGDGSDLDHWTRWVDKTYLHIPFEDWNTVMHANSAFLADWRQHDGYFYLFYAGSDDGDSFQLRGHGKIGVARSRDLVEWRVPPQ